MTTRKDGAGRVRPSWDCSRLDRADSAVAVNDVPVSAHAYSAAVPVMMLKYGKELFIYLNK